MWLKLVNFAALNYNTSYHTCIGCEPFRVFRGRVPYNVLDFKMGKGPQKLSTPISQFPKTSFSKLKRFSKMYAEMQCNLISNTKPDTTKIKRFKT